MPDRPLLRLPDPEVAEPPPRGGGGRRVAKPSRTRQGQRLEPRFSRLMRVVDSPRSLLQLRDDPAAIAPERAVVFEVVGSLADFYAQARDLGLEYLGDYEAEFAPDDDFYDRQRPGRSLTGRVYLAMPDVAALRQLVSLWQRFQAGERMPPGRGAWGELFRNLADVRPWGPQDRVPAETVEFWRQSLRDAPDQPVRFEAELWFHDSSARRQEAHNRFRETVEEAGGTILHYAAVPEIRYHAALLDLPPEHVQSLIAHPDVTLARSDEVMFLRPQAMAAEPGRESFDGEHADFEGEVPTVLREPIAALLDGLPIQNHARLRGRLVIDDPDDLDPEYPVMSRRHGTAMASLILHGDLNRGQPSLMRPLMVQPVMRPDGRGGERTPADRLLVDVIYRTVRRLKEGEGAETAVGPEVVLINVALGDPWRPFAGLMSPLARLLDYLAARYSVLFLVSAGNVRDRISVPGFRTSTEFEDADPVERENAILAALNEHKGQRTLYSPAEALNVITVGAAHSGSAYNGNLPANLVDPFTAEDLPNIVSAMGLGFRRAVKPEILVEGGRAPVRVVASGDEVVIQPVLGPARLFGARVAAPHPRGDTNYEDYEWGTSIATALATRASHLIHDALLDVEGGSNHADVSRDYMPLVIKALLVHGTTGWGSKGEYLDSAFPPRGSGSHTARRDDITRLLGYGVPDIERVLECAEHRATLIGIGTVVPGQALLYRIPLPPGVEGVRASRALTTTLAWFSPVNPRHQGYRMAALEVSAASEDKYWIAPDRFSYQPTDHAMGRGTILHERRVAEAATVFVDDGHLLLRISCRATAGDYGGDVRFALAVSFEVAVGAGVQVYDEVRTRLAAPVRAGIRAGT